MKKHTWKSIHGKREMNKLRVLPASSHLRCDTLLVRFIAPHHRVTLARPGLSVREYADVVSFERVLQHLQPDVLVDPPLCGKLGVLLL